MAITDFDMRGATSYHYGKFPPTGIRYSELIGPVSAASAALGRYDAMLRNLHNSEILLAPLKRREAVISSRMEGTVTTLEEILRYEAEEDAEPTSHFRQEVVEVYSFTRAMNRAQELIETQNMPLSGRLIKDAHRRLVFLGRGSDKQPGEFKKDQNYIVDRAKKKVLFIPVSPVEFPKVLSAFEHYINDESIEPLLQTAISHAEFEAIHPFKDGNGRIGRMLITLMLWQRGLISDPHFYISSNLESNKDEYIDRLRLVSSEGQWTEWVVYFLAAIEQQAKENLGMAERIIALYESMKDEFRSITSSMWSINALDFVFSRPVFRNSTFTSASGIPPQTAHRISSLLAEKDILKVIEPASGRRAALYAFDPLLDLVRA